MAIHKLFSLAICKKKFHKSFRYIPNLMSYYDNEKKSLKVNICYKHVYSPEFININIFLRIY